MSSTVIRFYSHTNGKYAKLSNFEECELVIDGKRYKTVEHYFQAMKHVKLDPSFAEQVRRAATAADAKRMAKGKRDSFDPDWENIKEDVMRKALIAKFVQNDHLYEILLSTEGFTIIEASPTDYYWGEGENRTGQNRLGVLLMEIRDKLIQERKAERT